MSVKGGGGKTWLDGREREREYGMKEREIANSALREVIALQRDAALTSTTKRCGETLKHVLPRMPSESAELPAYFDTVENVFAVYEVANNLKAKLILLLLSVRAKSVICHLTVAQMNDYDELKRFLLAQFKLTPREYKARFVIASKTADETYTLFKARLHNLLLYYIRSRQAEGDYERLVKIEASDRLKECLSTPAINYVMNLEGDAFFEPDRVAMLANTCANKY